MAEKLKVTLPRSRSPKRCYQDHTSQLLTMLAIHILQILLIFIYLFFVVLLFYWFSSLRKQPSFRNATLNNVWKTTEKTTAEIPYWWLHYPDLGRAHDWLICLIQSEELTRCGQYQVHLKNFPRPIFYEKKKLFRVFIDTIFTFGVAIILSSDWKKKRLRMFCFFILAQPWPKICRDTTK